MFADGAGGGDMATRYPRWSVTRGISADCGLYRTAASCLQHPRHWHSHGLHRDHCAYWAPGHSGAEADGDRSCQCLPHAVRHLANVEGFLPYRNAPHGVGLLPTPSELTPAAPNCVNFDKGHSYWRFAFSPRCAALVGAAGPTLTAGAGITPDVPPRAGLCWPIWPSLMAARRGDIAHVANFACCALSAVNTAIAVDLIAIHI